MTPSSLKSIYLLRKGQSSPAFPIKNCTQLINMRDKHSSMDQETQNMQKILPNSLGYQADMSHTRNRWAEFLGITVQGSLKTS